MGHSLKAMNSINQLSTLLDGIAEHEQRIFLPYDVYLCEKKKLKAVSIYLSTVCKLAVDPKCVSSLCQNGYEFLSLNFKHQNEERWCELMKLQLMICEIDAALLQTKLELASQVIFNLNVKLLGKAVQINQNYNAPNDLEMHLCLRTAFFSQCMGNLQVATMNYNTVNASAHSKELKAIAQLCIQKLSILSCDQPSHTVFDYENKCDRLKCGIYFTEALQNYFSSENHKTKY